MQELLQEVKEDWLGLLREELNILRREIKEEKREWEQIIQQEREDWRKENL